MDLGIMEGEGGSLVVMEGVEGVDAEAGMGEVVEEEEVGVKDSVLCLLDESAV